MKEFVKEHPFLTFFIATSAISGVVEIVRILKRPASAWSPPRCSGIPGIFTIERGPNSTGLSIGSYGSESSYAAGAAPSGSCPPGFYFDPATGSCVPFPGTPPYGGM